MSDVAGASVFPSVEPLQTLDIDSTDPFVRGLQRGTPARSAIARVASGYLELFHAVGVRAACLEANAQDVLEVLDRHLPDQLRELEGVAHSSGVTLETLALVNARTEVLAQAPGSAGRECSTIVSLVGGVASVQTWDWHIEFQEAWHLQRVTGTSAGFVGMTEFGILGKIGVNSHGVGVHLNILGHSSDAVSGVPVHLIAHEILARALSVEHAVEIVRSLPVSSSSTLTVVDPSTAVMIELSPLGMAVVQAESGSLLHTNHFLSPELAVGEKTHLYQPDSGERWELLRSRTTADRPRADVESIVPLLRSGAGEPQLCVIPDYELPFGERWATLATIGLDPEARAFRVTRQPPTTVTPSSWVELVASR